MPTPPAPQARFPCARRGANGMVPPPGCGQEPAPGKHGIPAPWDNGVTQHQQRLRLPLEARGRPRQHAPALARQWSPTRPLRGVHQLSSLRYTSASTARKRQQPAASAFIWLYNAAPRAPAPSHALAAAGWPPRPPRGRASSVASADALLTRAPTQAAAPPRQCLDAPSAAAAASQYKRSRSKSPCLCANTANAR